MKRRSFTVIVDLPKNVTIGDMKEYIHQAVACWNGGKCPDDPLYNLDRESVSVHHASSKEMKREDAVKYIQETDGKLFSVKFIKRTDGSLRQMLARTGVKKHLVENPTKPGVDFKKNELIAVFDMNKQEYRSIPVEGIVEIMVDGEWHAVS